MFKRDLLVLFDIICRHPASLAIELSFPPTSRVLLLDGDCVTFFET